MKQFDPVICPKCHCLAPELIRFPFNKWECPRCCYPTHPRGMTSPRWERQETMPKVYSDWYRIVDPNYHFIEADPLPEWYTKQIGKKHG